MCPVRSVPYASVRSFALATIPEVDARKRMCRVANLTQPILATKAIDPSKLALIVGHKNMTERKRLGGNK
jgi:hypothetical protein